MCKALPGVAVTLPRETDRLDDPALLPSPQVQLARLVAPGFTGPHTQGFGSFSSISFFLPGGYCPCILGPGVGAPCRDLGTYHFFVLIGFNFLHHLF